MNLTLSKDDGRLLENRIKDKTRHIARVMKPSQYSEMVRRAVDEFMFWLNEKSRPHVGSIDQLEQDYPNLVRSSKTGLSYGFDATMEEIKRAVDELARLRLMGGRLNQLRKNVITTQSATWSNVTYPLVAILNDAGYEHSLDRPASDAQVEAHMRAYGGAGKFPEPE